MITNGQITYLAYFQKKIYLNYRVNIELVPSECLLPREIQFQFLFCRQDKRIVVCLNSVPIMAPGAKQKSTSVDKKLKHSYFTNSKVLTNCH